MDIQIVKEKIDLLTLVELAGGKPHKRSGGWSCCCPIHNGDNETAFSVYPSHDGMKWKCFSGPCGGGDVIDFVMAWQKIDFARALHYLNGETGIDPAEMAQLAAEREAWAAREKATQDELAEHTLAWLQEEQTWSMYESALEESAEGQRLWEQAGVPRVWQLLWHLGYSPDSQFYVHKTGEYHHTPTLVIPVFGSGWKIVNIKHRLLNPPVTGDKYRYQFGGLPVRPWLANPDLAEGEGTNLVICEGEKKAMVVYQAIDNIKTQVLGIGGKNAELRGQLAGYAARVPHVYVMLDPDATRQAEDVCRMFGERGRLVELPDKADDLIIKYNLDSLALWRIVKQSRKVGA
jgi:hypothetical protein